MFFIQETDPIQPQIMQSSNFRRVLRYITLFFLVCVLDCSPPEDPIKCQSAANTNCTITNSYATFPDRSICRAQEVLYPTSEADVISAVATATKTLRKMKIATRFSHSIPKLVCPDGQDGLVISTKYLNRTLKVDAGAMTITVESGVTLKQLINDAAKAGMALPHSPYWWGLTVGGLLSTGSHGSSLWGKGSAVHDYVEEIQMVTPGAPQDGYAKVRRLVNGDQDLNAAIVSLGVLGVITRVTLKLQPLFKRSITFLTKNDNDLSDQVVSFGRKYEFADLMWYPSQHKVVYRRDYRVSSNTSGDGHLDFIPFRPTSSLAMARNRELEESQESRRDVGGKCFNAKLVISGLSRSAYGLTNNGIKFVKYPVIGYQNRVQSSGSCLDSREDLRITGCAWDPMIKGATFFHQTAISVGLSVVKSFIVEVQKLIEIEQRAFCGIELYNGILMRYVKASSAYLGKQEDAIDFDFIYYRSKDPMTPRLFEDVLEEVEQMALFKYGGIPHWGKNRNLAFHQAIKKYRNGERFLKVKREYDPSGLFSNEWTNQVLGLEGEVTTDKEGCALEGLCICFRDGHCAPDKGYFCRPGKVYKDARVCSYLGNAF